MEHTRVGLQFDVSFRCFYLGTAEGGLKKRFYTHRKSFNNEGSANDTTLSLITSTKFRLKQTWRLTKAMAEMKCDTEQTMKLE